MRRICLRLLFLIFLGLPVVGQVPLVNQPLVPASAKPGDNGFILTVNGTGFANNAVVEWNGSERITEFISSSQLKAIIYDSDVGKPGTAWVKVMNPGGQTSSVSFFTVRKPSSSFTFTQTPVFPNAVGVAVGDFNNDGLLDVAWSDCTSLYVSLGDGKGGFQAPVPSSGGCGAMIAADFDGDGNLDLAVTVQSTAIYLGDGHGNLTYKSTAPAGSPIAAADFNGDGILDLYVAGGWYTNQWFEIDSGNGDGTFSEGAKYNTIFQPFSPAIGDFNRDGWLDLVIPNSSNTMEFYTGGGGGFVDHGSIPYAGGYPIAADMNRDGKLDILVNGCILLGNGDGTFRQGGCAQGNALASVATSDFNGDGNLDVAMTTYQGATSLVIALGDGKGNFLNTLSFAAGICCGPAAIGDFNNDGWMDALTYDGYLMLQTTVSFTPIQLAFGDEKIGSKSPPQTAVLTNVGSRALPIKHIDILGADSREFAQTNNCGSSLPPQSSCQIQVTFKPRHAGLRSASLYVGYRGIGSPQAVALNGTGLAPPTVSLTPSSLVYAVQLIHTTSVAQTATLTNTGDQAVNISRITATEPFTQTNNCPQTLPVNTNCQISVQFKPRSRGAAHGMLTVEDDAENSPQKTALSGEGTVVVLVPLGINFGDQKVGQRTVPAPVAFTNKDKLPVAITRVAIAGADANDFAETSNCGTTVPPHGRCTIKVTFSPTQQGQRSATLNIYDDGGGSPQTVSLSGSGT